MVGSRAVARRVLAVMVSLAVSPPHSASAAPAPGPYDFETVEVSPRVFAFVQKALTPVASSNIVAVEGDSATLVYDTGHHPPITRAIIADIERLTDKPVRYIVVSHWHDDHWVGAADMSEAWPEAAVVAHPFTAKMIETRREDFNGAPCSDQIDGQTQPMRERLAAGKEEDGTPLSEATTARLKAWIEANDVYSAECAGMRFRSVDMTVDSSLTIDLGGRTVELEYLGRGNTAGDLIGWLPDTRTVLTGDLVVAPFPYATESYVTEWSRVLRTIEQRRPAIVVPGHGPVQRDLIYLDRVAAPLESIAAQATAAYLPGMTADDLRSRIFMASFTETFGNGDPLIRANFNYMMRGPAVDRMWQELSGEWEPEGG